MRERPTLDLLEVIDRKIKELQWRDAHAGQELPPEPAYEGFRAEWAQVARKWKEEVDKKGIAERLPLVMVLENQSTRMCGEVVPLPLGDTARIGFGRWEQRVGDGVGDKGVFMRVWQRNEVTPDEFKLSHDEWVPMMLAQVSDEGKVHTLSTMNHGLQRAEEFGREAIGWPEKAQYGSVFLPVVETVDA